MLYYIENKRIMHVLSIPLYIYMIIVYRYKHIYTYYTNTSDLLYYSIEDRCVCFEYTSKTRMIIKYRCIHQKKQ